MTTCDAFKTADAQEARTAIEKGKNDLVQCVLAIFSTSDALTQRSTDFTMIRMGFVLAARLNESFAYTCNKEGLHPQTAEEYEAASRWLTAQRGVLFFGLERFAFKDQLDRHPQERDRAFALVESIAVSKPSTRQLPPPPQPGLH